MMKSSPRTEQISSSLAMFLLTSRDQPYAVLKPTMRTGAETLRRGGRGSASLDQHSPHSFHDRPMDP